MWLPRLTGPALGATLNVAGSPYTITYQVTDASANTATCSFTITVVDTDFPEIVCPDNVVINNTDPGVCTWTAPVGSLTPLLVNSNCPATVAYTISGATTATGADDASGEVFNLGISTVTYTVTETASGQSWECSFTVTIHDEQSPSITCPSAINPGHRQRPLHGRNSSYLTGS